MGAERDPDHRGVVPPHGARRAYRRMAGPGRDRHCTGLTRAAGAAAVASGIGFIGIRYPAFAPPVGSPARSALTSHRRLVVVGT
jgi:hypothetical protein